MLESLVALSHEGRLDLGLLPAETPRPNEPLPGASLKQRVDAYERGLIVNALEVARGNKSAAARALGIGRATWHEKLHKHGLAEGSDS